MPTLEKYINCTYSEGMLPSEYSVTIHLGGRDLSLFAPKRYVIVKDREQGQGLLQVRIVDPEHNVIALPAEVSELGKRFIEISPEELRSA